MPWIQTRDNTDLYVKDWGSGRPVILVHGYPLNADSFDRTAMKLAEAGFRAISYDRRGFGRSSQRDRVVKAFNTVFAPVLAAHQPGQDAATAPTVFVAGDDAGAKSKVVALAAELGFDALDAGPLTNSRYLEGTLEQMIQLAQGQGLGMNIRLRVLRG